MTKALIHVILQCCDCEKRWENYLTAQSLARRHVETHHHTVSGELVYLVEYRYTGQAIIKVVRS
jgi:hypothetical protein